MIDASALLEVLKIVSQYESDAGVFVYRGILHIDGLNTCKKATAYERERIQLLGFGMDIKNAIFQKKGGSNERRKSANSQASENP